MFEDLEKLEIFDVYKDRFTDTMGSKRILNIFSEFSVIACLYFRRGWSLIEETEIELLNKRRES